MTQHPSSTCATCRFIGYIRMAGQEPHNLTCANQELKQQPDIGGGTFPHLFIPPNLAFGCNRYAERAPDIGMIPTRLRD